nr:ORF3 [Apple luteovirus 1]
MVVRRRQPVRRNIRRRRNGPRRFAAPPRVVVVPGRPRRRRRNGRTNPRANRGRITFSSRPAEVFTFTVDDLKAGSSGVLKFGPGLSQCAAVSGGVLKSYHQYKIIGLTCGYVTNASSTTAGAFALEIDTTCSRSALESRIISFPVTKNTSKFFPPGVINGQNWISSDTNQFFLLYGGNGSKTEIAGQLLIKVMITLQGPK